MARENKPEDCPGLFAEEYKPTLDMLSEYFGGEVEIEETGLIIDKALCTGCGNCVIACDKCNTIVEHTTRDFIPREVPSVLRVVDGRVTVAEWSSCKRCMDTPEWCRVCEQRCPSGALELVLK
jgi:4Fe-4S ferredoxin